MAIVPNKTSFFLSTAIAKSNNKRSLIGPNGVLFKPKSPAPPMACVSLARRKVGIAETFTNLRREGKTAFMPYICAGDPDLLTTIEAIKVLDSCGSDIIELGMPYSDPLADGSVIQAAFARALANGTNYDAVFSMLKEVIPQISCPIAMFTYYNPILKRGISKFLSTIRDIGVHGLIVPDVPLEESKMLREEAARNNIELVLLTTPTTPLERMKEIVGAAEGFVYLVSSVGVTGARASVNTSVPDLLRAVKESTDKPVAVGFGISTPEHVKQVADWGADGAIIGSAVVKILAGAETPEEGLKALESFTKSVKAVL